MKNSLLLENQSTAKLLLDIAFELGQKLRTSNTDAMNYQFVIDTLGRSLNWDYGEVWFVKYSKNQIVKSNIVYINENHSDLKVLDEFRSHSSWKINEGLPGIAWKEKKSIWMPNLNEDYMIHKKDILESLNIKCGVAIPIFSGDCITEVLFFMSRSDKELDQNQMNLFELLADRLGMLMLKIDLERELIIMKKELRVSIDLNFSTLNKILMFRDPYTVGHHKKVTEIAVRIAINLNFIDEHIEDLIIASQLHDIGKIAIPLEVLNKPGPISKEEYALIQTHVETSFDLISTLPCSINVKRIIHEHHERNDGSGYPKKLKSSEISPISKVLIVADVVSAMLEDRPYRKGLKKELVIEELMNGRQVKYDPQCVDIAIKYLNDEYIL